ncbi:MAG: hypothetical protein SFX72_06005 [Isosphaeraceae bacterium]|nr:hypothetical protein [Isosphaeraceae bacterium]
MTRPPSRSHLLAALVICGLAFAGRPASAQEWVSPEALMSMQRDAMKSLSKLDGLWRGKAIRHLHDGTTKEMVQTERVGTMLDGTLRVIEGRGYEADGSLAFQAFAVLSYDTSKRSYSMRSHSAGRSGDFVFRKTDKGFDWEIPAGPATIRYTATIDKGVWKERGERIEKGRPPQLLVELELRRLGDTDWPAAGSVGSK